MSNLRDNRTVFLGSSSGVANPGEPDPSQMEPDYSIDQPSEQTNENVVDTSEQTVISKLCAYCDKQFRSGTKKLSLKNNPDLLNFVKNNKNSTRQMSNSDFICNKCFQKYKAPVQKSETIQLPIARGNTSHILCTFGCRDKSNLTKIPEEIKNALLLLYNFYTTNEARMCKKHLDDKNWEYLVNQSNKNDFRVDQVEDIIVNLQTQAKKASENIFDFDQFQSMRNDLFETWIGLTKTQFSNILSSINIEKCNRKNTALAIYLAKLHTGDPIERIAITFNIPVRTAFNYFNVVGDAIHRDFYPL